MHARILLALSFAGLGLRAQAAGFERPAVWPVQIEISAENAAKLRAKPREAVSAKIRVIDAPVHDAKVRLKGQGTFQPLDDKPSFTIELGPDGQEKLHGLTKFHLNNSIEDPGFLKERIGSEMFERAGIPTPRVGHARVTLNERMLGLYVLKEGFTENFLKHHFRGEIGNLYDTGEGKDIDEKMELEIGGSKEQEELTRLAAAAKDPDPARRWNKLERALDLDRVVSFMAMEIMICHWDGYGLSQNNFRVYYEPNRDKVFFLPAGMDQIFSKADLTWKPNMIGVVARSILETSAGQEAYERKFRNLFETKFQASQITNRIAELVGALQPFLDRNERASIRSEAKHLSEKVIDREISLRTELSLKAQPPQFEKGVAFLSGWKPFDQPDGGKMVDEVSGLRIVAGPRTSASWRKTLRLKPGRYIFRGIARTRQVTALPFGVRHGASLRVIGDVAQSKLLMGNNEPTKLECRFEVRQEQEVTLACELRSGAGEATFEKLILEMQQ